MKRCNLIIICSFFLAVDAKSQIKYPTLDSVEHTFQAIWKDIKMPCSWQMATKRKANGKLIFFDTSSTRFEIEFLKASSLPFYTSLQTDFETTEQYYHWAIRQLDNIETIMLTKLEESEKVGFVILKVRDASGDFYRLLARHHDLVCSIKVYNKEMTIDQQFEKLKLLYELNRD